MTTIYSHVAGKTLDSHEKFLRKLKKRGATVVDSPEESKAVIVFCPIVSRYETDIDSALSSVPVTEHETKRIVVAMHPTFKKHYVFPRRQQDDQGVTLYVDCLFNEKMGLLTCSCNKNAVRRVREELNLQRLNVFQKTKKAAKKLGTKKRTNHE